MIVRAYRRGKELLLNLNRVAKIEMNYAEYVQKRGLFYTTADQAICKSNVHRIYVVYVDNDVYRFRYLDNDPVIAAIEKIYS